MKDKVRTMLLAVIVIIIIGGLCYGSYCFGTKKKTQDTDLKQKIVTLEQERNKYKADYEMLMEKLAKQAAKRKAIIVPKTEQETKERFGKLGYPPK